MQDSTRAGLNKPFYIRASVSPLKILIVMLNSFSRLVNGFNSLLIYKELIDWKGEELYDPFRCL